MLILVLKENGQDQAHIFEATYFKSFQVHHLTKIYCFEQINHNNPLNFLI